MDNGIPDSWSEPVGPTRVRVSPRAGGPGTVVTVTADIQGSDMRLDTYRVGYAKFRVLGSNANGGGRTNSNRTDGSKLPNRVDTGLGGTADGGQGGLDPTRLLLPAGVALIVLGAGLGYRQTVRSRR